MDRNTEYVLLGVAAVVVLFIIGSVIWGAASSDDVDEAAAADRPRATATRRSGCSESEARRAQSNVSDFASEWDDALAVASNTARISLAGPIGELQSIRRDAQNQDWPGCASRAHSMLVDALDLYIDGFLAFQGGLNETLAASRYFDPAGEALDDFFAELERIA